MEDVIRPHHCGHNGTSAASQQCNRNSKELLAQLIGASCSSWVIKLAHKSKA